MMDDGVYRDAQQYRCQYADKSGSEAYNDSLGVKHAGYILLRCADGTQYTDLLCALKDAYIGYDAYHYARNDETYRNECDENVGYNVNDRCNGAHDERDVIGVAYLILGLDSVVIVLYHLGDGILCREGRDVNVHARGGVKIDIAESAQVFIIARAREGLRH